MDDDNNRYLFPNEDNLLTKESRKGFADSLNSQEYKDVFNIMLMIATNILQLLKLKFSHFQQNH